MSSPTPVELKEALVAYPRALTLRAAASKSSNDLIELDRWYRTELRELVVERMAQDKERRGYLEVAELGRLMEWKLARGKWRPRLVTLALSNTAALVRSVTLNSSTLERDEALKHLSTLSGVGPATASAILALFHPAEFPFMSDEGMAMGRTGFKAEYTIKAWKEYVSSMQEQLKSLGWEKMADLEMAHWSWAILRRYGGAQQDDKGARPSAGKKQDKKVSKAAPAKRKSEAREEEAVEGAEEEEEVVAKPSSSRAERAAKRVKAGSS
ncbi:hypothetical protein BCR35DRAFT_270665 [Leucosporidium creatinivorum]|uniref:DNA glycosylase n=1 Tax=Leucosporidium creatinivorum TaxID=106004 RepID=A0A1Y2DUA5_9BASI|nr:hypothetical protein BCR35DRAFT_270665 [Leucosporidium creatinivorum]